MTPPLASLINAITLILCAFWAYWAAGMGGWMPLLPAGFGLALIACHPGVKAENKIIAHIAVLLTFVMLGSALAHLWMAFGAGNSAAMLRLALMSATGILAMIYFIKSFRDARRAREAQGG